MKQKQLGNTNVTVPKIGLGTWKYEGRLKPFRQGAPS
jgi:aryl-alcohol dehydrogenase-like predicted oxidoreductase